MSPTEASMVQELFTYVDTAEADWEEIEPGYRRILLRNDRETGTSMALVRYDAGYQLSHVDTHKHDEYLFIVSGTFVDEHRASGPGTFIHSKPGSSHQPSSPDGCTFFAMVVRRR